MTLKHPNLLRTVMFFVSIFGAPFFAEAKRLAPPVVSKITYQNLTIRPVREKTESQVSVSLVATETNSSSTVWKTELYRIPLDPSLESDVQEIAIRSITVKKQTLIITDERGQTFRLDASTGENLTPISPKNSDGPSI